MNKESIFSKKEQENQSEEYKKLYEKFDAPTSDMSDYEVRKIKDDRKKLARLKEKLIDELLINQSEEYKKLYEKFDAPTSDMSDYEVRKIKDDRKKLARLKEKLIDELLINQSEEYKKLYEKFDAPTSDMSDYEVRKIKDDREKMDALKEELVGKIILDSVDAKKNGEKKQKVVIESSIINPKLKKEAVKINNNANNEIDKVTKKTINSINKEEGKDSMEQKGGLDNHEEVLKGQIEQKKENEKNSKEKKTSESQESVKDFKKDFSDILNEYEGEGRVLMLNNLLKKIEHSNDNSDEVLKIKRDILDELDKENEKNSKEKKTSESQESVKDFKKDFSDISNELDKKEGGSTEKEKENLPKFNSKIIMEKSKEIITNKEIWKQVGKTVAGSITSIAGIKSIYDVPAYINQKFKVKKDKNEYNEIFSNLEKEKLDKKDTKNIANSIDLEQIDLMGEKIEGMNISEDKKDKLMEELNGLVENFHTEIDTLKKKENKKLTNILDKYVKTKITGVQVAKESLNTLFVASGAYALRGASYGVLSVFERRQRLMQEAKDGEKIKWGKDVILGGVKETWEGVCFEGEGTKMQKTLKAIKSFGSLARFVGITSTAFLAPQSYNQAIGDLLNTLDGSTGWGELGRNFVQNIENKLFFFKDKKSVEVGQNSSSNSMNISTNHDSGATTDVDNVVKNGKGQIANNYLATTQTANQVFRRNLLNNINTLATKDKKEVTKIFQEIVNGKKIDINNLPQGDRAIISNFKQLNSGDQAGLIKALNSSKSLKSLDVATSHASGEQKVIANHKNALIKPKQAAKNINQNLSNKISKLKVKNAVTNNNLHENFQITKGVKVENGDSVWSMAKKYLAGNKDYKNILKSNNGDTKEALETFNIDRIKDEIVKNPENYGLKKDVDWTKMSKKDLKSIKWQKAFNKVFSDKQNGVTNTLSTEKVDSIIDSNEKIKASINQIGVKATTIHGSFHADANVENITSSDVEKISLGNKTDIYFNENQNFGSFVADINGEKVELLNSNNFNTVDEFKANILEQEHLFRIAHPEIKIDPLILKKDFDINIFDGTSKGEAFKIKFLTENKDLISLPQKANKIFNIIQEYNIKDNGRQQVEDFFNLYTTNSGLGQEQLEAMKELRFNSDFKPTRIIESLLEQEDNGESITSHFDHLSIDSIPSNGNVELSLSKGVGGGIFSDKFDIHINTHTGKIFLDGPGFWNIGNANKPRDLNKKSLKEISDMIKDYITPAENDDKYMYK